MYNIEKHLFQLGRVFLLIVATMNLIYTEKKLRGQGKVVV